MQLVVTILINQTNRRQIFSHGKPRNPLIFIPLEKRIRRGGDSVEAMQQINFVEMNFRCISVHNFT